MNNELQVIELELQKAKVEVGIRDRQLPISKNPAAVYLSGISEGSKRAMTGALNKIADMSVPGANAFNLAWEKWEYQHSQALRKKLIDNKYTPRYVNKVLAALRGVLKECWRLRLMDVDTYNRAVDFKGAPGSSLPKGRYVPELEFARLFESTTCDLEPINARDAAILATLYRGGLRRSEIVALDIADYDPTVIDESGEVTAVFTIRNTKRSKDREVPITNGQREAVNTWLAIRGNAPGALFLPINKSGRIRNDGRLTAQSIYDILRTRRGQAKDVKPLSPHDFRRTFITDLEQAGVPLTTIADIVGHSDVRQTAAYTQKLARARAEAVARLKMDYQRPT